MTKIHQVSVSWVQRNTSLPTRCIFERRQSLLPFLLWRSGINILSGRRDQRIKLQFRRADERACKFSLYWTCLMKINQNMITGPKKPNQKKTTTLTIHVVFSVRKLKICDKNLLYYSFLRRYFRGKLLAFSLPASLPHSQSSVCLWGYAKLWCVRKERELWDLYFPEEQTSNEKLEHLVIGVFTGNRTIRLAEMEHLCSGVHVAVWVVITRMQLEKEQGQKGLLRSKKKKKRTLNIFENVI